MADTIEFDPQSDSMTHSLREAVEAFEEVADDTMLRQAFLTRSLKALAKLAQSLDEDSLGEATSSSSDFEVLVSALNAAPDASLDETDSAWLKARLRGIETKRELLRAEGGAVSSAQMGELLGITRQAVNKRRTKNQLLAVQSGGRGYRYPLWQVADDGTLFGLEDVLAVLESYDPWMTLQFFVRENTRLGGERPLDLLRREEPDALKEVTSAAETYGVHGAD
ncbi:MAG: hypothetical protein ACOCV2_14140 [Persicimonas sp.]